MNIETKSRIENALTALKSGQMIILMDDEGRENEGDLVMSAEHVTKEAINFMAKHGRGLICLSMDEGLIDNLQLPMMTQKNRSPYGTAFTVSIEAAEGVSTGISAADRAHTIKTAVAKNAKPDDLISPGHVFPLRARSGGVLVRQGQTEGSVDLMRLANLTPAAVICEILNDDGTMSRKSDLMQFSSTHQTPIVHVKDIIEWRIANETLISPVASSVLPLEKHGDFLMTVFSNLMDKAEHFSLYKHPIDKSKAPLVRIHSECITGDVFGSRRCDCGQQLEQSLALLAEQGGLLIYLRQEGRGIGLSNKLKAYALQEQGRDTVEANIDLNLPVDARDYAIAVQLLKYFNINTLRLITNNPEKINTLSHYGLNITERISLKPNLCDQNMRYLKTKKNKMGHLIDI